MTGAWPSFRGGRGGARGDRVTDSESLAAATHGCPPASDERYFGNLGVGAVFRKTYKQMSAHLSRDGKLCLLGPRFPDTKMGYAVCRSIFVLSESEKQLRRCGLADELLKFPVIWFFEGKGENYRIAPKAC